MTQAEILMLLENKFQGARKDGLAQLAAVYSLTFADDDEAIRKKISDLTEEKINAFVTEYRKPIDAEISKSIKTNEANLRAKFNFVEKNKDNNQQSGTENKDNNQQSGENNDLKAYFAEALKPLLEDIATLKSEKIKSGREKVLNDVLNAKTAIPNVYKNSILANFNNSTFATDEDFKAFVETTKINLATFEQELTNAGFKNLGAPKTGTENDQKPEIPEDVAQYLKHETDNQFQGKKLF